ncbi:MAG: hypothetical protein ACI9R3_004979 [Verrucomicrobiales bacterium]|jgi:hypothetical protein
MFENTDSNYQHHQPLLTEKIITDRKIFFIDLKENNRGRFLKITEDVRGRRDTIMLPIEQLDEFVDALKRVQDFDQEDGGGDHRHEDDDEEEDDNNEEDNNEEEDDDDDDDENHDED